MVILDASRAGALKIGEDKTPKVEVQAGKYAQINTEAPVSLYSQQAPLFLASA